MKTIIDSRILLYLFLFSIPLSGKSTAVSLHKRQGSHQRDRIKSPTEGQSYRWQLGIALYAFHTVSFPEQLNLAVKTGITTIEGYTFADAGAKFKDSAISQLSNSSLLKLKALVRSKGLKMTSIYIGAGGSISEWKRQFEIAKIFDVKYVTTEPPRKMWDSIDSLAGIFKMKVAIHNHWEGMSDYWNPDSVLEAIKGHPNFGACPDIGHWPKSGIRPLEGLKKLRGHIIGIHLKDIAAYNDKTLQDVPIGTGVINFKEIFKELQNQHFNGYINIERDAEEKPNNLASVLKEVNYYNHLMTEL